MNIESDHKGPDPGFEPDLAGRVEAGLYELKERLRLAFQQALGLADSEPKQQLA